MTRTIKLLIGSVAILLISWFIYTAYQNDQMTKGNTPEEIKRSLAEVDLYKGTTIQVLDSQDAENMRFVAFESDGLLGIAHYRQDESGDYRLVYTETFEDSVAVQISEVNRENYGAVPIVIGYEQQDTPLHEVAFKVNGEFLEERLEMKANELTLLVVEEGLGAPAEMEYHYYDAEGKAL